VWQVMGSEQPNAPFYHPDLGAYYLDLVIRYEDHMRQNGYPDFELGADTMDHIRFMMESHQLTGGVFAAIPDTYPRIERHYLEHEGQRVTQVTQETIDAYAQQGFVL